MPDAGCQRPTPGHAHLFGQEPLGQPLHPLTPALPFRTQQVDDLALGVWALLLGLRLLMENFPSSNFGHLHRCGSIRSALIGAQMGPSRAPAVGSASGEARSRATAR